MIRPHHFSVRRSARQLVSRGAKRLAAAALSMTVAAFAVAADAPQTSQRAAIRDLLRQGFEAMKQGDYTGAEAALLKARDIEPDHPFVLLNLGSAYAKQCRTDEARALFERVAQEPDKGSPEGSQTSPDRAAATAIGAHRDEVNQDMVGRTPAFIARYNLAHVQPCLKARSDIPQRLRTITLTASELFEFDAARLRPQQPQLDRIAAEFKRSPQVEHLVINGHSDALGTPQYNDALSLRRADAAKAYLVAAGLDDKRLTTRGWGARKPVVQCPGLRGQALVQCLAPNRRMEIEQITLEVARP